MTAFLFLLALAVLVLGLVLAALRARTQRESQAVIADIKDRVWWDSRGYPHWKDGDMP